MIFDNYFHLLQNINYGIQQSITAEQLFSEYNKSPITNHQSLNAFKRHLRSLAHEARLNGHKVIGDDNGYYIALTLDEWNQYKLRRLSSFTEEIKAFATVEKITIRDLIKNLFIVDLNDKNYELF